MSEVSKQSLYPLKKKKFLFWIVMGLLLIMIILLTIFIVNRITLNKTVKKATSFANDYAMVMISGGTFQMGKNDSWLNLKPAHKVTLNTFYIGKYEVTQKQWKEVMGTNPSTFSGCDDCPVEQLSWNDIQIFINKLNDKTSFDFRLPTEAEWEFAARGGNLSRGYEYAGSNDYKAVAWYDSNSKGKPRQVGMKDSNEYGLYDMSGNILEWCQDYYDENYYKYSPANNPKGPITGTYRVLKGGSWSFDYGNCQPAYRFYHSPEMPSEFSGFRLCRDFK